MSGMSSGVKVALGVGVGVGALALAVAVSPSLQSALQAVWTGDETSRRRKRAKDTLQVIRRNHDTAKALLAGVQSEVEAAVKVLEAVRDAEFVFRKPAPGDKDCGYYHFTSDGRKIKNKWDSFDVDAELARLDEEEEGNITEAASATNKDGEGADDDDDGQGAQLTTEQAAAAARRTDGYKAAEKVHRLTLQREQDFEKVLSQLDAVLVGKDAELKAERKALANGMQGLLSSLDVHRDTLKSKMHDLENRARDVAVNINTKTKGS